MIKDYGSFTVLKQKHVGQWYVELANMVTGGCEIIMTRSTDCLYDVRCVETLEEAQDTYRRLNKVGQIMNYIKNNTEW